MGYQLQARSAARSRIEQVELHKRRRSTGPGGARISNDLLHLVLSYSGVRELCAAQCCSKDTREVARRDDLWLRQLQVGGVLAPAQIAPAMKSLGLASCLQLAEALHRIRVPDGVVGYWRGIVDEPSARSASSGACGASAEARACEACREHIQGGAPWRGELLCITAVPHGFLCESVQPDGANRAVFRIRVVPTARGGVTVTFFRLEQFPDGADCGFGTDDSGSSGGGSSRSSAAAAVAAAAGYTYDTRAVEAASPAGVGSGAAVSGMMHPAACNSSGRTVALRRVGRSSFTLLRGVQMRRFVKLPPMDPPTPSRLLPLTAAVASLGGQAATRALQQSLCGLWTAAYGGHGMQILRTSLQPAAATSPSAAAATSTTAAATTASSSVSGNGGAASMVGGARLWGVKMVGDPNVPAGRCSFVADLERSCAPDEELMRDQRLVVSFPPSGAVVADLAARRPSMAAWYKGLGQINRVPGVWRPEWVDIDFVVYGDGPTAFSVVWSEPDETIRVMVDAQRLPGGAVPSRWP